MFSITIQHNQHAIWRSYYEALFSSTYPFFSSTSTKLNHQTITGTGWQPYQIYHVAFRHLDRGCNQANVTFAGFSNEIVTNEKLNDERMQTITPDIIRMN